MNITFCGHKASHSWVEQLAAGGGGGAIRSDQGWNISQRSSQQPPASHPRILGSGPDNLLASPGHRHNVHRAGAGDVPLHGNLCTESPRQHHQSPVPGEVQRWPGWGEVGVFTSSSIMRVLCRSWVLVKCEN